MVNLAHLLAAGQSLKVGSMANSKDLKSSAAEIQPRERIRRSKELSGLQYNLTTQRIGRIHHWVYLDPDALRSEKRL